MNCPIHKDEWLYENMMEDKGFCKFCKEWYNLEELNEKLNSNKQGSDGGKE